MKNYLKNKNFIPKKYVENSKNEKDKGKKRGVIYLVIINLFMVPITLQYAFKKEEVKEVEIQEIREEGISKDIISEWIKEVDKDIEALTVEGDKGIMTIKDINKIYSLENKEDISINNISQNENGYYILDVTKGE